MESGLKMLRETSVHLTASKRTRILFFSHKELDGMLYFGVFSEPKIGLQPCESSQLSIHLSLLDLPAPHHGMTLNY